MSRDRIHIALVVPATNTVMEPDFHRCAAPGWTISTWRLPLESVTREAEIRMIAEELPRVAEQLPSTTPDLAVFGCTSAGSLGGLDHDRAVAARLANGGRTPVVTVVGSMTAALAALRPRRIAVLTPYEDDLTRSIAACVEEAGYAVALARGMGIVDNHRIGDVPPAGIVEFARAALAGVDVDCVFLSCTNWRAIDAREELGVPVLSSNHVTLEGVRQTVAALESPLA